MATLAAVAAVAFGALAGGETSGQAHAFATDDDDGGVSGALSYRAHVVTPTREHRRALQTAFARTHRMRGASRPQSRALLAATHLRVLWALATFTLDDGTVVVERFSLRRGEGWRDLGATRARCPAVPPEVRSVWRRTACS